ncbi:hypothetical protein NBRC116494_09470 [Aurantivibrio plasticivorans]
MAESQSSDTNREDSRLDIARYILVVPAVLTSWLLAVFAGIQVEVARVALFCPPEFRDGAECYASGWEAWPSWLMLSDAALCAVFVVLTTAITVPRRKLLFSGYTYALGCLLAAFLMVLTGAWQGFLAALLAGFATLYGVKLYTKDTFSDTFQFLSHLFPRS